MPNLSDYEKDNLKKKQELEFKKSVINDEEFEKENYDEFKPKSFKEKVQNYWYHNKIITFIILFFIALAIFMGYQFLKKPKFDIKPIIATQFSYLGFDENIKKVFENYTNDIDGNGKIEIIIENVILRSEGLNNTGIESAKLLASFQVNYNFIYIMDNITYDRINPPNDMFVDLSEIYPDNKNIDGHKFYIKGTKFGADTGLDAVEQDLFLLIRSEKTLGNKISEKDKKAYNDNLEILKKIIKAN